MGNYKSLSEILSEAIALRGLSPEKLAEMTNIPKRYILALQECDERNIPAAPYVRGYLAKIATVLDIDSAPLYAAYKELNLKKSGCSDELPRNRFAIVKSKKGLFLGLFAFLIVTILIGIRLEALLGIPTIEVNIPAKVDDRDFLETRDRMFTIEGRIDSKDSLIIEGEPIPVSAEGRFSKDIPLEAGLNRFEIKVKRFLGKEKTVIRNVFYITDDSSESSEEETAPINNNGEENQEIGGEEEKPIE